MAKKEEKTALKKKRRQLKEPEEYRDKLQEYNSHPDNLQERHSYSKTDKVITDFALFSNPTDTPPPKSLPYIFHKGIFSSKTSVQQDTNAYLQTLTPSGSTVPLSTLLIFPVATVCQEDIMHIAVHRYWTLSVK